MKPILLGALLLLAGCGIEPNLVSLDVSPATAMLCGAQAQVQFLATGIYFHPYSQRDLTTQVTWASDAQRVADFVAVCSDTHDVCQQSVLGLTPATCAAPATCILVPGLLTAGSSGSSQVSASMNRGGSKIIVGNAAVTVTQTCP